MFEYFVLLLFLVNKYTLISTYEFTCVRLLTL